MDDFKIKTVPDPNSGQDGIDGTVNSGDNQSVLNEGFKPKAVPDPDTMTIPTVIPFTPEPSHKLKNFLKQNKWYIIAMLVGLIIIGVLAFIAFRPQKQEPTQKAKVGVSFDAPEIAPATGDVIYKIRIKNEDTVKLVNMELELLYPDGLSYVSSTPKADNLSGSIFKIPDLPPGTDVPVVLKVAVAGDVNNELKLIAKLNYRYDKFNSLFTEESAHSIRLTATDVILDFTGPNSIAGSQTATYDLYYRNNSNEEIPNARIILSYPNGFVFAGSDPAPTIGQNTWDVGTVKNQDGGKITITGNFMGVSEGSGYLFEVEFQAQDGSGNYFAQSVARHETSIVSQPLSVEHRVISGASGNIVSPGDEVSYEVNFRNNSPLVATGVNIEAEIITAVVSSTEIKGQNAAVRGNTIFWNASSSPVLATLGPSAEGTLRFSLKVNNPAIDGDKTNLTVVTKVRIKSNEERDVLPGNEITLKINSPASLARSVNHVSGPLPLRVGQQSTFEVNLEVRNSSNDLQGAVLSAVIPVGVEIDLSGLSGEEVKSVKYDKATGRFSWEAGFIPAHSGRSKPAKKIALKMLITPSPNQVNDSPTLIKGIVMTARDSFTGQNLTLRAEDLSTGNLPGQDGLGRVEP